MHIRTALIESHDAAAAMAEIAAALGSGEAAFVALHFGADCDAAALRAAALTLFPRAALHGGTSCLGAMSGGRVAVGGAGIAALAFTDPEGAFGSASRDLGADARAAAVAATEAALEAAGRPGEAPELIWLTVAPGREEEVLAGVKEVVGPGTLIVGGSSADSDVSGNWRQFSRDGVHSDGVVVSALFPSGQVASTYRSGYAPTDRSAVATRVDGRRVVTLDGAPAAQVYAEWTGIAAPGAGEAARSILAEATWQPLGRVTGHVAGVPFHLLAHPAVAEPDGALMLFADVREGERLWLMHGRPERLVDRAGRVADEAWSLVDRPVAGALVVYCGGCMLAVRDRIDEVAQGVDAALGGAPHIGIFTFGEQGSAAGRETLHGNLMISCTVFAA